MVLRNSGSRPQAPGLGPNEHVTQRDPRVLAGSPESEARGRQLFCKVTPIFERAASSLLPFPARFSRTIPASELQSGAAGMSGLEKTMTCIGETIRVKGQLSATEDILIAGRVEGEIQLQEHVLTVERTAEVDAEVLAKSVIIGGAIRGDVVAGDSIALHNTASVSGRIAAPRVAITEGASFNGRVETA